MPSGSTKAVGTRRPARRRDRSVRSWPRTASIAACAALLLAACGDSSNRPSGRTSTTRHSATTTTTTAAPSASDVTTSVATPQPGTKPPVSTTAGVTTSTAPATTLFGTVSAGPTCPVERPDQPCPPAPVHGTVQALDGNGQIVGQAPTDAQGRYDLPI